MRVFQVRCDVQRKNEDLVLETRFEKQPHLEMQLQPKPKDVSGECDVMIIVIVT